MKNDCNVLLAYDNGIVYILTIIRYCDCLIMFTILLFYVWSTLLLLLYVLFILLFIFLFILLVCGNDTVLPKFANYCGK